MIAPQTPAQCDRYVSTFLRYEPSAWGHADRDAFRWVVQLLHGMKAEMLASKDHLVVPRVAVVVAADGSWAARGSSSESDEDMVEAARADLDDNGGAGAQLTFFVGFAAKPTVATVNATSHVIGDSTDG